MSISNLNLYHRYHRLCYLIIVTITLVIAGLPFNVSSGPCDGDGQFDSITCDFKDKLTVTYGNNYYIGECDSFPFYVNPDAYPIVNRKIKIITTVVDAQGIIYFFEGDNVIILINKRPFEKSIDSIFNNFNGRIKYAVSIPDPVNDDYVMSDCMIQLYTDNSVFKFVHKIKRNGLPFWTEEETYSQPISVEKLNRTIPPVARVLGVSGQSAKVILASQEGPVYYQADISFCSYIVYRYNLTECIEEDESFAQEVRLITGQLIKCNVKHFGFNLLSLMLWGCAGLVVLSVLGLLKCSIVWIISSFRKTKRKVRFSDEINGDPRGMHYYHQRPPFGLDQQPQLQSYDFDSMAHSAVSINEEYKDIDISIDLKEEDHFASMKSDSRLSLEPIQSLMQLDTSYQLPATNAPFESKAPPLPSTS